MEHLKTLTVNKILIKGLNMRIKQMISILLIAAMGISFSGCYGSFSLTKKVYKWNGTMDDDIVTNVVFWALVILPVYEGCMFIDAVVLNTIEHWTGDNPLAFESTEDVIKTIETQNGLYTVTVGNQRIKIDEIVNEAIANTLIFELNEIEQSWSIIENGHTSDIAQIDNDVLKLYLPDGEIQEIELVN